MSESLVERSRALLAGGGAMTTKGAHPMSPHGVIEKITDDIAMVSSFANVAVLDSHDGLVLVDTGGPMAGSTVRDQIRTVYSAPVHTAIYTHGHIDHVMGTAVFDAEADEYGRPHPRVLAHEAVGPRFDRYCLTAGYNASINRRQFSAPGLQWPTDYRRADDTYVERFTTRVGDVTIELHHARGESDDATWVWVPEHRLVCTGDLFIWCIPNAGNPQKAQRYARDWAVALRTMASLEPEILLPGHGLPIVGAESVEAALVDTADLLDSLVDQTLASMNAGMMLDDILHTVSVPERLTTQAYLQPIYDEPEFIVRNLWRLYGGWYDGNPSHLKPARDIDLASEIAALAGGASILAERAQTIARAGDDRLAGHLIEMAALAAPDDPAIHRTRAELLHSRADHETSLMAKAIFSAAARDSEAASAKDDA